MKKISNFKPHVQMSFILIFVSMVLLPHTKSLRFYTKDDSCIYGKSQFDCPLGSYDLPNTRADCPPRELCYLGVGARCDRYSQETKCARGLECICGSCMNCLRNDCRMDLCPKEENNVPKRWISPYERNWLRFYKRGGGNVTENDYYYYSQ